MLEYENAFLLAFILPCTFNMHNNTMCERERKKERKNQVNVPSSEVTLTSRRAHFLLIASIPTISSSFTRELQLPPLSQQQQQLSHLLHHHQHHQHLTLHSTTTTILPHHTSRAHHYYRFTTIDVMMMM
jgi:hypothetical protein